MMEVYNWLVERAQSSYDAERDATQKLRDRIQFLSATLLTPIAGSIIYLITTFKGNPLSKLGVLFVGPIFIAIIIICFSLYYISKFFTQKSEYGLPYSPKKIIETINGFNNLDIALRDTKYLYAKSLARAVEHNQKENQKRLKIIINAQKSLIFSIPFVILSTFEYIHASFTASSQSQVLVSFSSQPLKITGFENVHRQNNEQSAADAYSTSVPYKQQCSSTARAEYPFR